MVSTKQSNGIPADSISADPNLEDLRGQRVAVVVFSHYPSDPRPRRAAEALAQVGMKVDVISLVQEENEPRRETFNGVNILRVPLKHWRGGKLSYAYQYGTFILAAFLVLAWRSLRGRYRLVHVHNMPDILVFAALIPKVLGAKVILDLHDPMPELMMTIFGLERESFAVRTLRWLEKRSIRLADRVLTVNLAFVKLFAARSCPEAKLGVIMNSPDERIFVYQDGPRDVPAERDPAKPFVVMYHGAIVDRHGLDVAMEAIEKLSRSVPRVELHIFGRSTPFLDKVLAAGRERNLQDRLLYQGAKSLEQIAEAIDRCDVGIIPNRRSVFTEINLPTRIFEYLARGKPVIAPRTVGIQDYFGEEELVFFEPGSAEDLAGRLQYVFAHPREVNEIVKQGQRVYRAHKWSEQRARFVALASELLTAPVTLGRTAAGMRQPR